MNDDPMTPDELRREGVSDRPMTPEEIWRELEPDGRGEGWGEYMSLPRPTALAIQVMKNEWKRIAKQNRFNARNFYRNGRARGRTKLK